MNSHEALAGMVEKEISEFRNEVIKRIPTDIYNSWYKIGFYEDFYEMFSCDYVCYRVQDEVFDWLSSHERPLEFLYDMWLDCDGAFNHDWDAMSDWVCLMYEERDRS